MTMTEPQPASLSSHTGPEADQGAYDGTDGHQAQDTDSSGGRTPTRAPEQEKIQAGDDEVPGGGERLTGGRSGDTEAGYNTR